MGHPQEHRQHDNLHLPACQQILLLVAMPFVPSSFLLLLVRHLLLLAWHLLLLAIHLCYVYSFFRAECCPRKYLHVAMQEMDQRSLDARRVWFLHWGWTLCKNGRSYTGRIQDTGLRKTDQAPGTLYRVIMYIDVLMYKREALQPMGFGWFWSIVPSREAFV